MKCYWFIVTAIKPNLSQQYRQKKKLNCNKREISVFKKKILSSLMTF